MEGLGRFLRLVWQQMIIVITLPHFIPREAEHIVRLLQRGDVDLVHIRKPESTAEQLENLVREIPAEYYSRLVLHDHHYLAQKYALHGVHLNGRSPNPPLGWTGSVSRSCHTLSEVAEWKPRCDYLSLSPIFDSISKTGYHSAFTTAQIAEAVKQGIIDDKVLALGGVTFNRLDEVCSMGFGGAMILGDAWNPPVVLSIAGSDPSAGAGIQQDLKTITNIGCYGATVITALTSQNTMGVQGVMPVPANVVESQLRSIFDDMSVRVIKIGMIPNTEVADVIIRVLKEECKNRNTPIVLDPIMLSTSGTRLMSEDCISTVVAELFPLCTLVTPNIPEHNFLKEKFDLSCINALLLKGGHADGSEMTDTLIINSDNTHVSFSTPRIDSRNLHGTGCTLSSAIASYMAKGHSLIESVKFAKSYITKAIDGGKNLCIGKGNGPLWVCQN